ncbi:hypothetical protein A6456_29620 [Paraburkholderia tropica]|nr:hypothetical protein A6456_29620 [Paraburkholderia tropica]
MGVNLLCALREIAGIKQFLRRVAHGTGIGHMGVQIGEGESHCFNLKMHSLSGTNRCIVVRKIFQQPKRNQRSQSLAIRGDFVYLVPPKLSRDGSNPLAFVSGQIERGQRPTAFLGKIDHLFGKRAVIERLPTCARDVLERFSLCNEAPDLAGCRSTARRQEGFPETRLTRHFRWRDSPLSRNHRAHREAISRMANCILKKVAKR